MPEKIKILYIDDEPDNLVGFKASLRLDYHILTAVNVPQALSCLENHPDIRIIFCDQRMPDKTGVEFFEEVRISYPLPVRILLTAYTDVESINDGTREFLHRRNDHYQLILSELIKREKKFIVIEGSDYDKRFHDCICEVKKYILSL